MSMVLARIDNFFRNLKIEENDENILLKTIRVPRELLSLTNRLPKPNYEIEDKHNRHTTMEHYLPDIGNTSFKVYRMNHKLFGYNPKVISYKDFMSANSVIHNEGEKILERKEDKDKDEYDSDFEEELKSPPKKEVIQYKRGVIDIPGYSYNRIHKINEKSIIEVIPSKNKSNIYKHVVSNPYYKKLRHKQYNMQRIVNGYKNKAQQLSFVAKRLLNAKQSKISVSKSLIHKEAYNEDNKLNESISSKIKLEPIKQIFKLNALHLNS